MNLRNEILSIAFDLREGSMTTDEAVKQLRELINDNKPSVIMATSEKEVRNELYKRILKRGENK
jgi:hypothetical protein